MPYKLNPFTGELDYYEAGGGEGGAGSSVNAGAVDGTTEEVLQLFFNTEQQALKIFFLGNWITVAQVSFDSLWDSLTDEWDSATMSWDSPNS